MADVSYRGSLSPNTLANLREITTEAIVGARRSVAGLEAFADDEVFSVARVHILGAMRNSEEEITALRAERVLLRSIAEAAGAVVRASRHESHHIDRVVPAAEMQGLEMALLALAVAEAKR